MFQPKFGGRFTNKKKRTKASEQHDGQECAEMWHTSARSLDTEKVEHGFKNMLEMRKTESLQNLRNDGVRDVNIHVRDTSIYNVQSICLLKFSAESKNRPETPTHRVNLKGSLSSALVATYHVIKIRAAIQVLFKRLNTG